MTPFKTIHARAEKRKGGAEALAKLMPPKPDPKALRKLRDDRVLAEMTKRVFSAGFAWSVIESKWPGFEEAFFGFEPRRLSSEPGSLSAKPLIPKVRRRTQPLSPMPSTS